jgi:hypothetical protein
MHLAIVRVGEQNAPVMQAKRAYRASARQKVALQRVALLDKPVARGKQGCRHARQTGLVVPGDHCNSAAQENRVRQTNAHPQTIAKHPVKKEHYLVKTVWL